MVIKILSCFLLLALLSGCVGNLNQDEVDVALKGTVSFRVRNVGVLPFVETKIKIQNPTESEIKNIEVNCETFDKDGKQVHSNPQPKKISLKASEIKEVQIDFTGNDAWDVKKVHCRYKLKHSDWRNFIRM